MPSRQPSLDETSPIPKRQAAWGVLLVLSLLGLALSIVLERLHYKANTDPAFQSFCAVSSRMNCDTVARSPYAVFVGVPTAVWGIVGYVLAAMLSLWGLFSRNPRLPAGLAVWVGIVFALTSAFLGALSAFYVSSLCMLCLATYGTNFLFLLLAWVVARPVRACLGKPFSSFARHPVRWVGLCAALGVTAGLLVMWHPKYWLKNPQKQPIHRADLPHGMEPGGGHYLGAEKPILTITEFSDYECPFCQVAHHQLREYVDRHPTRLRLIHRHYPLDQSCNSALKGPMHESACYAAMLAECAARQGRFWQGSDYLFANARFLKSLSEKAFAQAVGLDAKKLTECLKEEGPRAVSRDVDEGNRLNIEGTPAFFVEGKRWQGNLRALIEKRVQESSDAGTP